MFVSVIRVIKARVLFIGFRRSVFSSVAIEQAKFRTFFLKTRFEPVFDKKKKFEPKKDRTKKVRIVRTDLLQFLIDI